MPGLVLFGRRWSAASDDFVYPSLLLAIIHFAWLVVMVVLLSSINYIEARCRMDIYVVLSIHIALLLSCMANETILAFLSSRGSILETERRKGISYAFYVRFVILIIQAILALGGLIGNNYARECDKPIMTDLILYIGLCDGFDVFVVLLIIWFTFDTNGRSFVKYGDIFSKLDERWVKRCDFMCCLAKRTEKRDDFVQQVALLFSDYFRDLDLTPSDVFAGLTLLRWHQKLKQKSDERTYYSGVAITSETDFLDLNDPSTVEEFKSWAYYFDYCQASFGWPLLTMMINGPKMACQFCSFLSCCCFKSRKQSYTSISDNCCHCNTAAFKYYCRNHNYDIIYVTFEAQVSEPAFFVAVDYEKEKIIVAIRGTMSLQDIITDLNANNERLFPNDEDRKEWYAHRGIAHAAFYIKKRLQDDRILERALHHDIDRNTDRFQIVLTGHSLGGAAAAILAVLLRDEYPDLICYSFSPPSGLLSESVAEYTQLFVTTIVYGKEFTIRLGIHQMDRMRHDVINLLVHCMLPKWKIVGGLCCCSPSAANLICDEQRRSSRLSLSDPEQNEQTAIRETPHSRKARRYMNIASNIRKPLFLPGRVYHIVRKHNKKQKPKISFEVIYSDNHIGELLISPAMLMDHMPWKMKQALHGLYNRD